MRHYLHILLFMACGMIVLKFGFFLALFCPFGLVVLVWLTVIFGRKVL